MVGVGERSGGDHVAAIESALVGSARSRPDDPWKAAFPWTRDPGYYIFEYGCHEGDQAMVNALRNSRYLEATKPRDPRVVDDRPVVTPG
jgi:hypothetical protein